jgi:hypothetical protein
MKFRPRHSNEQIKARLVFIVGIGLTVVFVGTIISLLYGLLFVQQPQTMAESDKQAWSLLTPLLMSLSGTLAGILAANGLKDRQEKKDAKDNDEH